ncbi:MAG: DUF1501 domain-containing protein [Acidobacteriota bacterium]|nr:DUF1501 domain-containing protein [Acidobacteriota bacterium]
MLSRRGLFRIGAASVGSLALRPLGLLPALAQGGPDYRALVCIFLFGGNDSNNTVVPMDDASYKLYLANRGALALSGAELTSTVSTANGAPYAFHSGLSELASLFSSKELAVVANVGSLVQPLTRAQYQASVMPRPSNLFSHSDQQLQWQSSIAQGNSSTGWAGRAADYAAANGFNASLFPTFFSVAGNSFMGAGMNTTPVALAPGGSLQITGSNGTTPEAIARTKALEMQLLSTDTGLSLVQAAGHVVANSITDADALSAALGKSRALSTQFPATGIGAQLKQVAEIIQVHASLGMQRQIFFCALGGFDTHTDELNQHKNLYPQLSPAIAAFYNATQELGVAQDVTTFTESDFSRTFQATSGNGSDHAWGSHHMVVGGAVKGGRVFGRFPSFQLGGPDDTDTRGRWIPTTSIDQYGATLSSWFGIPQSALFSIFPNLGNFDSGNLGFLG